MPPLKQKRNGGADIPTQFDNLGYQLTNIAKNISLSTDKNGGCGCNNRKKGGTTLLPMPMDSFGSKLTNIASGVSLSTGGSRQNKKGGAFQLAPLITSLALLGLRALNDKAFKSKVTKSIGSVTVSKPRTTSKPKSKSRTTSKYN